MILICRGSNPPAPASQPVFNVSHMKVAQKLRGTARFRGYDSVSVCEIRPWKRHFGPLSPRAHFWCLVLCVPYCPFPTRLFNDQARNTGLECDASSRAVAMLGTPTVLLSADTAAMLFWALLASGQINMRKADGWQTLSTNPVH
jgi:hypothetical protein